MVNRRFHRRLCTRSQELLKVIHGGRDGQTREAINFDGKQYVFPNENRFYSGPNGCFLLTKLELL